jgi:hypothetical protein
MYTKNLLSQRTGGGLAFRQKTGWPSEPSFPFVELPMSIMAEVVPVGRRLAYVPYHDPTPVLRSQS